MTGVKDTHYMPPPPARISAFQPKLLGLLQHQTHRETEEAEIAL